VIRAPWSIALAAVALRIAVALIPFDFSGPDSRTYLEPAASLARGEGYCDAQGRPTGVRPPGYPTFVAAIYIIAGRPSPLAVRLAQALLGGAAVLLVHRALTAAGATERVALAGAALLALDPIAAGQSPYLLREALLLTLVAATLAALVALRGRARYILAGLALAALALTHQLYILLGPLLAAGDLLPRRRDGWRALAWRVAAWTAVGLMIALPVVLWARRNERLTGRLSFTLAENAVPARELWLTVACPNRWLSSDPVTGFQAMAWQEEERLVAALGVEGAKRELYARAWTLWREHPARSLGRLLLMNFWYWAELPGAVSLVQHPRLHVVRWALLPFHWMRLAAAVAGLVVVLRAWPALRGPCGGTLAFFALAPALLYPIPRYLAPCCPALDLLAALGIAESLRARGGRLR
jgi:4-amino-4-deoxy-L-arabinose transferase-like glycosyltransferase